MTVVDLPPGWRAMLASDVLAPVEGWWREAKMWTLMYRGGLLMGICGAVVFVLWRIVAARRERLRLEALVADRTRQLRQGEELFRSIFEYATEGIFQSSLDGRNLRANLAMAQLCGYADADADAPRTRGHHPPVLRGPGSAARRSTPPWHATGPP